MLTAYDMVRGLPRHCTTHPPRPLTRARAIAEQSVRTVQAVNVMLQ